MRITWGGKREEHEREKGGCDKHWDGTPQINQRNSFPSFEIDVAQRIPSRSL
jgi:hypothetical protein